jgi:hypothetical protein
VIVMVIAKIVARRKNAEESPILPINLDILSCVKVKYNKINRNLTLSRGIPTSPKAGLEFFLALATIEVRKSQHVCKFEEALGLASHLIYLGHRPRKN